MGNSIGLNKQRMYLIYVLHVSLYGISIYVRSKLSERNSEEGTREVPRPYPDLVSSFCSCQLTTSHPCRNENAQFCYLLIISDPTCGFTSSKRSADDSRLTCD